ncbi:hypothetical protein [Thermosipho africanus]|uniref:hypothetical protein n=1 Tax=Thermosipho africanus TaxID=2421 RepID=UPI0002EE20B7|nr:hypothetical protein [Thermosipho africanus]
MFLEVSTILITIILLIIIAYFRKKLSKMKIYKEALNKLAQLIEEEKDSPPLYIAEKIRKKLQNLRKKIMTLNYL